MEADAARGDPPRTTHASHANDGCPITRAVSSSIEASAAGRRNHDVQLRIPFERHGVHAALPVLPVAAAGRQQETIKDEGLRAAKHGLDEAFHTTDFEEDFAIIGADSIERTLTLDVFVVLTRDDSTSAHELLESVAVPLPGLSRPTHYNPRRAHILHATGEECNSQIDVGRFKLEMVEVRKTPKQRTPALSMQSESDLSEINAVTPERPASDVVRLVVHARSATLGDAVDAELRLRCSTGSGAAETAAQVCSAACTVVWNELLVLEAPATRNST